jgi:iron complex outermembrane receptor protein
MLLPRQTNAMGYAFSYKKVLTSSLFLAHMGILFAQEGYVKGRISNGNENLAAATICLGNITTLTNINGEFSFAVKAGNYTLTITHAGYEKIEQLINVDGRNSQRFDFIMTPVKELGQVVVLGSRSRKQRSNLNTPVPVDVISPKLLLQTGQVSLTQMLNFTAPSFNASRETLNEPFTLRGLDPQHVLIQLNGTRYHNTALLENVLKGVLGLGSVGNDLTSIPFSAIEKIEILRDGASAQYGSDATAGVINIELKQSTGHTSVRLHAGQYYKGDGEKFSFGINHGIAIGKNKSAGGGFLNISGDFRYRNPTYRGGEYIGSVYYDINRYPDSMRNSMLALDNQTIKDRNFDRKAVIGNIGNLKILTAGALVNGVYHLSHHTELFWTAAYTDRTVSREAEYRFPKFPNQVNLALYPDGFQPMSKPNTADISAIVGIRDKIKNGWHWNISSSFGNNTLTSRVSNSNNATQSHLLGKNAQTSFYRGKQIYNQLTNNINFVKSLSKLPGKMTLWSIAFGAEWRLENFQTKQGEEASWQTYDPTFQTQVVVGGIGPKDLINKFRNASGLYLDLETELNNRVLLDIAGRYEYYNDFGRNFAGKVAARYKLSNRFSMRGSFSNGFRAPSLQQRYIGIHGSTIRIVNGVPTPLVSGLIPNDNEAIKALGVPSLTAENSINLSGGFIAILLKHINATVDAYWIQIKNRVVMSGTFDRRTNYALRSILDSYPNLFEIDQISFFANAVNTRTAGVDIVLNGNWKINKTGLGLALAANFTKTRLFGPIKATDKLPEDSVNTNSLFNREERTRVEYGQPGSKIILSVTYKKGKTEFYLCNTRFGKTATAPLVDAGRGIFLPESFSSKVLTDFNVNYSLEPWLTITAGANNIFNVYPDRIKNAANTSEGRQIYSPDASPFGFNGGYYFMSMSFDW